MKIILCVDDRGGILFNDRRLSRDSAVIGDIISLTEDSVLYTDEYSAELFEGLKADIRICDDPLSKAGEDDFCFIEKTPLSGYEDSVGGYIIYRWNRRYPADVRFDDGLLREYAILDEREFAGSSHEKITVRIYGRHRDAL